MPSRLNKISLINEWQVVGAPQEGYAFVCAKSKAELEKGLDRLQQQTGEQFTKFNVGVNFGDAPPASVVGKDPVNTWVNKKDQSLNTIVPPDCGYFFQVAGWLRKLECCKGPQRNEWGLANHQAKADLEDSVCVSHYSLHKVCKFCCFMHGIL